MSAQPIVSFLDGAALNVPIGGERAITVRFDNIPDAGPGGSVGYSPYVNLILPTNGLDGAGFGNAPVNDGVAFLGATYLGAPLEQWVLEFPASGQVTHPFTTDALGNPVIVTGTPGETLVVLRLPFGSFTSGQTAADIQVKLDISDFADLDQSLTLQASGGFAYGRDPLLNPVGDAPVFGPSTTLTITPKVIELDKVYVGPEQETATGPSYPREWLVKALIADGQTVTGLKLTDIMPDGTFIKSVSIVNGTGTTSYSNTTGLVEANFTGSYTGGVGGEPTLKIEFYVPEFLRDGVTPVLDPVTGAFRVLENNARLDATWDPTDGRDPIEVFAIEPAGPEDIITAKSIAVQKHVSPVTTLKAGENLQWTLDGQVSNYFNMDDLELIDTLGDGQVFDASVPVTITMKEGGATLFTGTIDPDNITVTRDPTTGISTIRFDISQEMRDRFIDDVLNGRPGGVENQATVVVKFQSTIEQSYISTNPPPSNEPLVDQGDPLVNDVDFGGVVDEHNNAKSDDSAAGVKLPVSEVGKSIYAINGSTTLPPGKVNVSAGDEITFRLTLDMPLTGAHDVMLSDFLPLPVLKAIAGMTFTDAVSAATPGANQAKWGPGATFDTSGDPSTNPTISFDSVSNSLKFDFGDAVAPNNPSSRIDLLFTVVVQDEEFGDGLLLTNQVTSTETNSFGTVFEDNPDDRISSDDGSHRVTIDKPGVTKTIIATSDTNTGATRHNGGREDVRIGEEITYEIKVRLPEGDSTNLRITDLLEDFTSSGNGTLTYVANSLEVVSVGSGLKTFAGGTVPAPTLTTSSPGNTTGIDQFVLNFGDVRNTVVNDNTDAEVITLRIKAVVNDVSQNVDRDVLTNTATVDTDGTPATSGSATVDIDVVEPDLAIDKSSSIVGGQALDAGALVNYSITIQHKSSSDAPAYDLALTDLIPAGMELVAGTLGATFGTVSNSGNAITWGASEYLLGAATVTITYQARLLNTVTPAQVLSNTARLVYDSNPADPVDPLNPTAAEDLASRSYNAQDTETRTVALAPTIDKAVIATGDANTGSGFVNGSNPDAAPGETVTYKLTVTVGEGTQRLVVSDSLPAGLIFESASVESIGATITGSALSVGSAATSISGGAYSFDFGTIVNAGDNDRDAGDTITILVTGRVATTATAGSTLTNTATAETYAPGGGKPGLATVTDDAKIDVVRPDLVIVKDAAPGNAGDAGNLVTYTITLSHAAGSTSPAYQVPAPTRPIATSAPMAARMS